MARFDGVHRFDNQVPDSKTTEDRWTTGLSLPSGPRKAGDPASHSPRNGAPASRFSDKDFVVPKTSDFLAAREKLYYRVGTYLAPSTEQREKHVARMKEVSDLLTPVMRELGLSTPAEYPADATTARVMMYAQFDALKKFAAAHPSQRVRVAENGEFSFHGTRAELVTELFMRCSDLVVGKRAG